MKILVTGSAGFIGFHLTRSLLIRGEEVVGIDNLNEYYDVNLKLGRLAETGIPASHISYGHQVQSQNFSNYQFVKLDLTDQEGLQKLFKEHQFDVVCHLAAQAGVRYSLVNPQAYLDANIQGFLNILECCRQNPIKHLVYASSSSVYGLNKKMPFTVDQKTDLPISLYAASKKSNELMAHAYSYLFQIPTTGLRFFTVYGPWGRPDMALFLFTKSIIEGKPIQVFNRGLMKRDFTYIDDIVAGILGVMKRPVFPDPLHGKPPYRLLNIGRGKPLGLMDFINEIESNLQKKAKIEFLDMQDGDVAETWADTTDLENLTGYVPLVDIAQGVKSFIDWYKTYYSLNPRQLGKPAVKVLRS
ncbi:MAG TPA: NAD-dependent epimerase [Daejeonella sp.]|nr:NAD-dependent epimerase [Daejeonella sp.]